MRLTDSKTAQSMKKPWVLLCLCCIELLVPVMLEPTATSESKSIDVKFDGPLQDLRVQEPTKTVYLIRHCQALHNELKRQVRKAEVARIPDCVLWRQCSVAVWDSCCNMLHMAAVLFHFAAFEQTFCVCSINCNIRWPLQAPQLVTILRKVLISACDCRAGSMMRFTYTIPPSASSVISRCASTIVNELSCSPSTVLGKAMCHRSCGVTGAQLRRS